MATITANTRLADISYSAGEAITIPDGTAAVLTIDEDTTIFPGTITGVGSAAAVELSNPSTTTPIIITLNSNVNDFRLSAGAELRSVSNWITLFTSNGSSGQTVDMSNIGGKSIDYPSLIEVETASASGEFEPWPVVCINAISGDSRSVTEFTSGEIGKVCFYDEVNQVLSFGDDVNGTVPPNGAIVRMPNIHITSAVNNSNNTQRSTINTSPGGVVDLEIVQFSNKFYVVLTAFANARLHHIGTISKCQLIDSVGTFDVESIAVGQDPYDTSEGTTGLDGLSDIGRWVNSRAVIWRDTSTSFVDLPKIAEIKNVKAWILDRRTSFSHPIRLTNINKDCDCDGLHAIGSNLALFEIGELQIKNVTHSDRTDGVNTTLVGAYAVALTNCNKTVIDGLQNIPGGAAPRLGLISDENDSDGVVIKNIDYNVREHCRLLLINRMSNATFANVTISNFQGTIGDLVPGTINSRGLVLKNIVVTPNNNRYRLTSGARFEFCVASSSHILQNNFPAYVDGGQFNVLLDSSQTTGLIQIGPFGPKSSQDSYDEVIGAPTFNSNGQMRLSIGDEVVFKSQESCRSITTFQNVAPDISFTGTGNWEYEIVDSRAEFTGVWQSLTGANLAAETITNSDRGFDMRIRLTVTSAGSLSYIRILTNNDSGYTPVVGELRLNVEGLIIGSNVVAYEDGINEDYPFATVATSSLATATVPYNFDGTLKAYILRIRLAGYEPQEIVGSTRRVDNQVIALQNNIESLDGSDPSLTSNLTITNHGASPVSWDVGNGSKDYSITIQTDATGDSFTGQQLLAEINYSISQQDAYFSFRGDAWPEMLVLEGSDVATARGRLIGSTGSMLKGVRVITSTGGPHPAISRFQSDDGTYGQAPIATAITINGYTPGSRIYIRNATTDTDIYNDKVAGSTFNLSYTEGVEITTGDTIEVFTVFTSATNSYDGQGVSLATTQGVSVLVSEQEYTDYADKAIDGSLETEYILDGTSLQLDIQALDNNWDIRNLSAWYRYQMFDSAIAIKFFFNALNTSNGTVYEFDTDKGDLLLDNLRSDLAVEQSGYTLKRKDGAVPYLNPTTGGGHLDFKYRDDAIAVIVSGASALQPDERNAVLASATEATLIAARDNTDLELDTIKSNQNIINTNIKNGSVYPIISGPDTA